MTNIRLTKLFLFFLLLIPGIAKAETVKYIQLSSRTTPSIQAGTTSYWYWVASGTVNTLIASSFTVTHSSQTGFQTMLGSSKTGTSFDFSTTTYQNGRIAGTVNNISTMTFQDGEFSGTRNDNSTITYIGANFGGTKSDTSTTTFNSATFNGLINDKSTTTYTGRHTFQNGVAVSTFGSVGALLDVGVSSVTVGIAGAPGAIFGTNTNNDAATGYYGEFISSKTAASVAFTTTGQYFDPVSVSLTAGDWSCTSQIYATSNGATVTQIYAAATVTPGNSAVGFLLGDNQMLCLPPTSGSDANCGVNDVRFSVAVSTTVYGKTRANYSAAIPNCQIRLSCKRSR